MIGDSREREAPPQGGWSLPLRLDAEGKFVDTRASPADTLRLVLDVDPGERPLEPEFGCRLRTLAEIESPRARQVAAALVEEAVERWLPWLGLERAEVLGPAPGGVRLRLRVRGEWSELTVRGREDLRGSGARARSGGGRREAQR